jgi:hypothetical protein
VLCYLNETHTSKGGKKKMTLDKLENLDELENYVSPDGHYRIPIVYAMYSTIDVTKVKNLREAVELSREHEDEIPLGQGEYIDGSYKININNADEAIAAQDYARISDVVISPEDFASKKGTE